jgi:hypothetical protein
MPHETTIAAKPVAELSTVPQILTMLGLSAEQVNHVLAA